MKRQASLEIPFGSSDFCTVQSAADPNLDSLCAKTQCGIDRLSHRAAECDSLFELHRDGLGDELRVQFRTMDLLNVDIDLAVRPLLNIDFELVDFRALAADDDSRPEV